MPKKLVKQEEYKVERQITFDLNTKSKNFKNSFYKKIKNYLTLKKFKHIQGSVYISTQPFSTFEIHKFIRKMVKELPWLKNVTRDIVQTEIGERSSLMTHIKTNSFIL